MVSTPRPTWTPIPLLPDTPNPIHSLRWYPFTSDANDYSGNGNHGTLINGAAVVSTGDGNKALNLSVTYNQYVNLTYGTGVLFGNLQNYSICTWAYHRTFQSNSR